MEIPKFETALNGYNIEQVDSFIEELNNELICSSVRIECLAKENKSLRNELLSVVKSLSEKLEDVDNNNASYEKSASCNKESVSQSEKEIAKTDFESFKNELQNLKSIFG